MCKSILFQFEYTDRCTCPFKNHNDFRANFILPKQMPHEVGTSSTVSLLASKQHLKPTRLIQTTCPNYCVYVYSIGRMIWNAISTYSTGTVKTESTLNFEAKNASNAE